MNKKHLFIIKTKGKRELLVDESNQQVTNGECSFVCLNINAQPLSSSRDV